VASPSSEVVRVRFVMSGGPATAMSVPAELLAPDRVRLLSAPWAALNAAKADVYRVQTEDDGELWAQEKIQASGFCALRLILTDDSPLGTLNAGVEALLEKFSALGVTGSGMFGLAVIDLPPDCDLTVVRDLLDTGQRDGWWDFEELCVTDAWKAMRTP
jgi:hypothetical protein